jgi:hypothetical protein
MMGLLALATGAALLVIAGFIKEISATPAVAQPAALTATAHSTPQPTRSRSSRPSPSRSVPGTSQQITDASSGLSYQLLASPWQPGCPRILDTPEFSWTAGENAVAGRAEIGGTVISWHGNACSGLLGQQVAYSGPGDLETVATSVADAVWTSYYAGLSDYRAMQGSYATQVSGYQAWIVSFLVTYPDAASEALAWTTEAGTVVVADRGAGQAPALFYASVPDDLGTSDVSTLVSSLQLTAPAVSPG